jgi:polysaccharide deacetylase family protein (PEP-CTERM system associated)
MIRNALTVDVEDYFQVAAFSTQIDRSEWEHFPLRVEENTRRLLEIFSDANVKATFFVLGWVAERCPALVRTIVELGHEIACHGYAHQEIFTQDPRDFRSETIRAKACLEDQAQRPVVGYRAASYSITSCSLWALDVLAELEFAYDSSIFPIYHDRYGIPGGRRWPHIITTQGMSRLVEFPPSTLEIFGHRIPVAGGGYFRFFPYEVTRLSIAHINNNSGMPCNFYLHPWEIDPEQPRIQASWRSRFRHYTNLARCEARLRRLLSDFAFAPVTDVLGECALEGLNGGATSPHGAAAGV